VTRAGLVAGVGLGLVAPAVAEASRVVIAPMVVGLLFLAVLRLGPEGVRAGLRGIGKALGVTLALQLALPVAAALAFLAIGWQGAAALGIVLMLAAAPITGSPNIAIMSGGDPVPALRQLVLGTALLPFTVIPSSRWCRPSAIRRRWRRSCCAFSASSRWPAGWRCSCASRVVPGHDRALRRMDGLAALILGGGRGRDHGRGRPGAARGRGGLGAARAGAGGQLSRFRRAPRCWPRAGSRGTVAPLGIVAGNRNIALFLSVLPAALVDELLLFIGLYQIPMYLTPLVMAPFYRWLAGRSPIASRQ
jgi:arsenite transporter